MSSKTMMALREKSFLLAHGVYESFNIWAADMPHTSWRVHPDTYAEMLREARSEMVVDLAEWAAAPLIQQPPNGLRIVNWLGIPLLRDADVPEGEIELRWAVRSA